MLNLTNPSHFADHAQNAGICSEIRPERRATPRTHPPSRARYEATEHGRHYHLIDVDTGRVIEFEDQRHEALMREIAARLGFDLVSHRLELFGRKAAETPKAEIQPLPADPSTHADPPTAASGSQTRNKTLSHSLKQTSPAVSKQPSSSRQTGAR